MSHLAPALDSLSLALSLSEGFDPSTSDRIYRIAVSDDVEHALMPSIVQTIRNVAPNVKLIIKPSGLVEHLRAVTGHRFHTGCGTDSTASTKSQAACLEEGLRICAQG